MSDQSDLIYVCVGASAGGLEALRSLVSGMRVGGRFTYVVAQHLSPRHESLLTSILSDISPLPVVEASDSCTLKADTVYVVPPNKDVFLTEGDLLRIVPLTQSRPPHPNVDHLFISMAEQKRDNAVGIILSGTGSDGTLGAEAIKAAGGLVIAQDDVTAKYSGMPHSVVSAGHADAVCAPSDMYRQMCLLRGIALADVLPTLPDNEMIDEIMLHEIAKVLAERGELDMSHYKKRTVSRRVRARMREHGLLDPAEYIRLLESLPAEIKALQDSVLISVTSFFRDGEPWEELRSQLEKYFERQGSEATFRAWVPGCATGEEAYSLAMMLHDILGPRINQMEVKVFATDMDAAGIDTARSGSYPADAISQVPDTMRDKYFRPKGNNVRIDTAIRDMCVFARHDVTASPPFMHIDLISCRNLLIYFDDDLQQQVFEIFHSSLKRGGLLMLGKSEAATRSAQYFTELDRKSRIYMARDVAKPRLKYQNGGGDVTPLRQTLRGPEPSGEKPLEFLERMALEQLAPATLLLDESLILLASLGPVNKFLKLAQGAMTSDIRALLPEEVAGRARAAFHRTLNSEEMYETRFRAVEGWPDEVLIRISPVHSRSGDRRLLVSLEAMERANVEPLSDDAIGAEERLQVLELEQDLALTQEHLQTVVEELEIANEELQTMNEELNSSNEELQASNEQLATSNEELQSTNEELVTVNDDLERKTAALAEANIELNAILESFGAPVMLLDRRRRLVRANRVALDMMDRRLENIGRFFDEVEFVINLPDVSSMLVRARKTGEQPFDMVKTPDGRRMTMRVIYIAESAVESAAYLIVFTDQTELMAAQDDLRHNQRLLEGANERQTAIINGLAAHVALIDHDGFIVQVNDLWRNFGRLNGYSGVDFGVGRNYLELCEAADGDCSTEASEVSSGLRRVLNGETEIFSVEYPCHSPTSERWFECIIRATPLDGGRGAAVMHVNITEKKLNELALKRALEEAREAAERLNDGNS